MKLGEFLTNIPPGTGSAKKERVEFTVLAKSTQDGTQLEAKAFACFALISDREHQEAEVDALKAMQDLRKDLAVVPQFLLDGAERVQVLLRVLRDYDDPRSRFAATAEDLQRHIPRADMERLTREYDLWVERWYPKRVTAEDRAALKHEAVGK